MEKKLTYLDTYILQQDMRLRLPKSILTNLPVQKGISSFDIYLDSTNNHLILKIHQEEE
jgi:hypothetical protein BACCOPRO_03032